MKRFLVSFIIGITLIAAGTATTFFELQDFDFVQSDYVLGKSTTEKFTLNSDEQIDVYFDDDYRGYMWDYDESMRDGEVKIMLADTVSYRIEGKKLTVYDHESYADYGYWHSGGFRFKEVLDDFMSGLKEHKVYTYNNYSSVRIVTNRESRKYVNVHK